MSERKKLKLLQLPSGDVSRFTGIITCPLPLTQAEADTMREQWEKGCTCLLLPKQATLTVRRKSVNDESEVEKATASSAGL